ncbi:hypothetical protein MSG28_002642 [Choristoneura fumiferana]|uniref:Uncharacterized protein n=1 Tax=Choristoneura fumiferana TaxID=7141 RepID=A0ACC0JIK3_CHOFU|nr:hypothetical protein MSG28_002642 [Choristoneura fumiferana]
MGQTKGLYGVGFLIKREYKENILNFSGISERICILELNLGKLHFAIIQAYAPTESSTQEEIDKFYNDLEKAHNMISTQYIIAMGDFNAQIGKPKSYENKVAGIYGFGKRSKRGERLMQYVYEHNLKIINTMFKSKANRRWTWISPDKNTRKEIDYITTTKPKLFSKYELINSFSFGTDHRLLRATLSLSTKKQGRRNFTSPRNSLKSLEEIEMYLKKLNEFLPDLIENHERYTVTEYYKKIENCILTSLRNKKQSTLVVYVFFGTMEIITSATDFQIIAEAYYTIILIGTCPVKLLIFINNRFAFRKFESLAKVLDVEPKRNGESDLSYGERLNEALRRFYVAHLDHVDWFGAQLKTKVLKFSYQAFTVLQTIE